MAGDLKDEEERRVADVEAEEAVKKAQEDNKAARRAAREARVKKAAEEKAAFEARVAAKRQ